MTDALSRLRDWVERETGERLDASECWAAVICLERMNDALGTVPEYRKGERDGAQA